MKFKVLTRLFKEKHPEGSISRIRASYHVRFTRDSKLYRYSSATVYNLAEKLDLVPQINMYREAQHIVTLLEQGEQSVIALQGAGDTARALWSKQGHTDTISELYTDIRDKFGRSKSEYIVESHEEWR